MKLSILAPLLILLSGPKLSFADEPPPPLVDGVPVSPDPGAAMACSSATDPGDAMALSLTYPGGIKPGLWLEEATAKHAAQRIKDAEFRASLAAVPWWVWMVAGVALGGTAGYIGAKAF